MQRVKFTTNYFKHQKGDIAIVENNIAFGLIDKGVAIISKDMAQSDYKTLDEGQANARTKLQAMQPEVQRLRKQS